MKKKKKYNKRWVSVRKRCFSKNIPDFDDSWALVELHRWQYGQLPMDATSGDLDISIALEKLAEAIEKGEEHNFPTPFNMIMILRYLAKFKYNNIY